MGKGYNRRPRFVPDEQWKASFERVFGAGSARHIDTVPAPERVGQRPGVEGAESVDEAEAESD